MGGDECWSCTLDATAHHRHRPLLKCNCFLRNPIPIQLLLKSSLVYTAILPFHFSLHFTCWVFLAQLLCPMWIPLSYFLSCGTVLLLLRRVPGRAFWQWKLYFWHGILPAMGDKQSLGPYITMSEIVYTLSVVIKMTTQITDKIEINQCL